MSSIIKPTVPQRFTDSLASRFHDREYSDLTITYGCKTWKAHKIVLCNHSDYFRNACKQNFKEGQTGQITLSSSEECDIEGEDALEAVLQYCYEFKYDVPDTNDNALLFHSQVFVMADRLAVSSLCDLCVSKLKAGLGQHMYRKDFKDTVELIYEAAPTTGQVLRNAVVDCAVEDWPRFSKHEGAIAIMGSVAEFTRDLVFKHAEQTRDLGKKRRRY